MVPVGACLEAVLYMSCLVALSVCMFPHSVSTLALLYGGGHYSGFALAKTLVLYRVLGFLDPHVSPLRSCLSPPTREVTGFHPRDLLPRVQKSTASLLTTVTAHSPPSTPYSFPPCLSFSHPSPKPHPSPCPAP